MFKIFGSKKAAAATTALVSEKARYELWVKRVGCGQLPHDFIGRFDYLWQAEEAARHISAPTSIRKYSL